MKEQPAPQPVELKLGITTPTTLQDELTKLKFIGSITAQRLRNIQAHLGYDVPFTSIETGNVRDKVRLLGAQYAKASALAKDDAFTSTSNLPAHACS